MAGSAFAGEEYWLREPPPPPRSRAPTVGLETRAGERWPLKIWGRFDAFEQALKAEGIRVTRFGWKSTLAEHEAAVASCDVVVCGDTLTMHLALALRRRVVALFLCTPPQEIEDYGRMTKIISPLIARHLYSRRHNRPAAEAIPVAAVLAETRAALAQASPR
jgi:heptosyltransferase-2